MLLQSLREAGLQVMWPTPNSAKLSDEGCTSSEAAEHLFGLAHGDKIKKAGTLPPFWIWSKTQETFASQQWILNLISHDSAGMEAMCKVSEQ